SAFLVHSPRDAAIALPRRTARTWFLAATRLASSFWRNSISLRHERTSTPGTCTRGTASRYSTLAIFWASTRSCFFLLLKISRSCPGWATVTWLAIGSGVIRSYIYEQAVVKRLSG